MSNCWKCGKPLPSGQVECEYTCGITTPSEYNAQLRALEAEAARAKEIQTGVQAFKAAAQHAHNMGCPSARGEETIDGVKYLIFVKRIS